MEISCPRFRHDLCWTGAPSHQISFASVQISIAASTSAGRACMSPRALRLLSSRYHIHAHLTIVHRSSLPMHQLSRPILIGPSISPGNGGPLHEPDAAVSRRAVPLGRLSNCIGACAFARCDLDQYSHQRPFQHSFMLIPRFTTNNPHDDVVVHLNGAPCRAYAMRAGASPSSR
jgi:hypothetical protein